MIITLLRHAQTAGNMLRRYIGSTDERLCKEGRATAGAQYTPGKPAIVYTSVLQRTVETAKLLYPQARIVQASALNEMDFGAFENKNYRELSADPAYGAWLDSFCEGTCPGGESKAGFVTRCRDAFWEIAVREAEAGTQNVYMVVHGGTIMAIMSELAAPERPYFGWQTNFCGGFLLGCDLAPPRPLTVLQTIPGAEVRKDT